MNVMERTAAQSSPDVVVEAIMSGVYAGRMVPGQRLVEADLTRNLGVSRGPVREALKRLAAEGLVTLSRHRGAYVRALSRQEAHDTLVVLERIVGLVARLAAERVDLPGQRALLADQHARLVATAERGDFVALLKERRDFYDVLIRMAGNGELARLMPLMQIHLLRLQFQSYVTHDQRAKQFLDYAAITDAVLAGNRVRADRLMQIHIKRTRLALMRLPDEAFAAAQP
ncbi:MAG: GntR family transcriptional regulator [Gemmobacter sp.]